MTLAAAHQSLENSVSEYDRWQTRYATPEYAFGKSPNYFLESCKRLLPRSGRALAVADGEGRNGIGWLNKGSMLFRSIFHRLPSEKLRLWRRNAMSKSPLNWSMCITGITQAPRSMLWPKSSHSSAIRPTEHASGLEC